ncbi:MAG: trypsin-like peptidase domain-containing protein [Planctomycetaceae bacterium]|nr:trypsin-like peptidase domain-containing protein [Planctomycetaceae bacterium]
MMSSVCRLSRVFLALVILPGAMAASAHAEEAIPQRQPSLESPKDLAGFKALGAQIKSVVAKALPAVVGIRVGTAWGSGVVVSEDGIVMTAGHVVDKPGQSVTFYFADGKKAKGKTLGDFASADAGLMKITDPGKWPSAPMGQSTGIKVGDWCVAIGHPLGYSPGRPPVVRVGRVLQKSVDTMQTDCPLVGGDSGGPLLDLNGNVIGINSRIGSSAAMNLHVPVEVFRANWDRLLKAELWRAPRPGRNDPDVRKVFRQVVQAANGCVVRIKRNGREAALGTIVGPDGWVLTKASEILNESGDAKGKLTCQLRDGRSFDVRVVGVLNPPFSPPLDLAMLKIDAQQLPTIPWTVSQPAVGDWLASAGMDDDPIGLGVVSVPRRAIPPAGGGVLGVQFNEKTGAAQITYMMSNSPASIAGLKVNDVVTGVEGKNVADLAALRSVMRRHKPGETVMFRIKRGTQTLEVPVRLAKLGSQASQRKETMNSLGVGVSSRSDDFAAVIQHDTVLRPVDCGGPVIDVNGRVVGINIAHGGRTETYCLPSDMLLGVMYPLMSGQVSPASLKAVVQRKAAEEKLAIEKAAAAKKLAEPKTSNDKKSGEDKAAANSLGQNGDGKETKGVKDQKPGNRPAAEK